MVKRSEKAGSKPTSGEPAVATLTEEEVKNQFVLPWLHSFGIDPTEIRAEQTFTIQLGRQRHKIGGGDQNARGRLDLLVTHNGRNLCVVEVKREGITLNDNDRKQAVSYARLLERVPPLCAVTNGTDWIFVDPMTHEIIARQDLGTRSTASPSISEEDRLDALKFFVGYSAENLAALSRLQVLHRMRVLLGSNVDRDRSYIPDLYEPIRAADATANAFYQNGGHCFVVVGESGAGKTAWLCNAALRAIEQGHPTFFYRAQEFDPGVLDAIAEDLNWSLSATLPTPQAIRRMLGVFGDQPVLVFVDGLDDLGEGPARKILERFLLRVNGARIKLIFGCKPTVLERLYSEAGTPTSFKLEMDADTAGSLVRLGSRDDEEFYPMLERYRRFYRSDAILGGQLWEDARRDPFVLRTAFEAAESVSSSHVSYDVREVYERFWIRILERTEILAAACARILSRTAVLLYDRNRSTIDPVDLHSQLELPITEEIPERLFDISVLMREPRGAREVGFYHDRIRDFVIAMHGCRWQFQTPEAFREILHTTEWSGVRLAALRTYYSLAQSAHKRVVDEPLFSQASRFVARYDGVLTEHFPTFKVAFAPHTRGRVGLVAFFDIGSRPATVGAVGLRAVTPGAPNVELIPTLGSFGLGGRSRPEIRDAFARGVHSIQVSSSFRSPFDVSDAEEFIRTQIEPGLREAIKRGGLDESRSQALLTERVLALWFARRRSSKAPRAMPQFPVDPSVIVRAVLRSAIDKRAMTEAVAAGETPVERVGRMQIVSWSPTADQCAEFDRLAERLARNAGTTIPVDLAPHLAPEDRQLVDDLAALSKLGVTEIRQPPTSTASIPSLRMFEHILPRYHEQIRAAIAHIVERFLDEYQTLVSHNFPTLARHFELFSKMPVLAFVAVEFFDQQNSVEITFCAAPSVENSVRACAPDDIEIDFERSVAHWRDEHHAILGRWGSILEGVLRPNTLHLPYKGDSAHCSVRELVYGHIEKELATVIDSLSAVTRNALDQGRVSETDH